MYKFGDTSEGNLVGVHPQLVAVVRKALTISEVDFGVTDGVRTPAEQQKLVDGGFSQTLKSRHLKGQDGYGHAVDLVPAIGGKLRWDWPPIYKIAVAMKLAAHDLSLQLEWGAVWDRRLEQLSLDMEDEQHQYVVRRKAAGKKAFLDGPHYQMPVSMFP